MRNRVFFLVAVFAALPFTDGCMTTRPAGAVMAAGLPVTPKLNQGEPAARFGESQDYAQARKWLEKTDPDSHAHFTLTLQGLGSGWTRAWSENGDVEAGAEAEDFLGLICLDALLALVFTSSIMASSGFRPARRPRWFV